MNKKISSHSLDRIQISSGRGPVECELAVALYLQYLRNNYTCFIQEQFFGNSVEILGKKFETYKSVIIDILDYNDKFGSILWIANSPVRPNHKRKNWFIQVKKIITEKKFYYNVDINSDDLRMDVFRCQGNGGQKVNKCSTGVRLTHVPTGFVAQSQTARTQSENRRLALIRLKEMMVKANNKKILDTKSEGWEKHNELKRGNPVLIFKGLKFEFQN